MALETANYIDELVITNPTASDSVSQGDDQLRLIKKVVKQSFPSVDIAVNAIHTSATAPATSISAGLVWFDTTANLLKLRDEANSAWITLPVSVTANNTVDIDGGAIDGTTIGATSASTAVVSSLNVNSDGATVTGIKDEDDMASNSAVKLATQQSIKAYVDTQLTAEDLDITTDSGTIDIDLDSETLTVAGGSGLDTSASSTTVTVNVTDGGVTNAKLADMAANTVKVRNANSSGVPSDVALATTEILIGDGTGFTAAAVSGDATMTNAGVVTVTKIQGEPISSTTVANDQYLKYSSASSEWQKVNIVGDDKLTTKGDLLAYNTADSETRFGVGTNAYVLTADSTATNGFDWKVATVPDAGITNAKLADMSANTVKVRNANSSGVPSDLALTTTQIMIGDGTGFTAAALSGDVSMTNAGVVAIASDVIVNADIKSDAAIAASKLGAGVGKLATGAEWTKTQNFNSTSLTYNATQTWDTASNQVCDVTLTANTTFSAPTNQVDGGFYSVTVIQDGTGSRTGSWNSVFKWAAASAPTLTTTASAKDIFVFRSDGTNMLEVGRQLNVS